ncbi:MAG: hypothetical protein LBN22_11765 [Clostridiales Family XIII bacterium]|jgi:hypothetical protein|nr:hypothetical protein [Clostridiales Family XIII bacterium]
MASKLKKGDINLLQVLEAKVNDTSAKNRKAFVISLVIIIIIAAVAVYVLASLHLTRMKQDRDQIQIELNDPTLDAEYQEAQNNKSKADQMNAASTNLTSIAENIKSFPALSSEDYSTIFTLAGAGVKVGNISYDSEKATLTFSAESTTLSGVPIFISQLRSSGVFKDVSYQGYVKATTGGETIEIDTPDTTDENGNIVPGIPTNPITTPTITSYNFNVSVLMSKEADAPAEQPAVTEENSEENPNG